MSTSCSNSLIHTTTLNKLCAHARSVILPSFFLYYTFNSLHVFPLSSHTPVLFKNAFIAFYWAVKINPILWLTKNRPVHLLTSGLYKKASGLKRRWGGLAKKAKRVSRQFIIGSTILKKIPSHSRRRISHVDTMRSNPFLHPTFLKSYKIGYQNKLPLVTPYIRIRAARAFFFNERMTLKKPRAKRRRFSSKGITKNPQQHLSSLYRKTWQKVCKARRDEMYRADTIAIRAKAYRSYKKGFRTYFVPIFRESSLSHHQRCRSVGVHSSFDAYTLVRAERFYRKEIKRFIKKETNFSNSLIRYTQQKLKRDKEQYVTHRRTICTRYKWLRRFQDPSYKFNLKSSTPEVVKKLQQSLWLTLVSQGDTQPIQEIKSFVKPQTWKTTPSMFYVKFLTYYTKQSRKMRNYLIKLQKKQVRKYIVSVSRSSKLKGLVPNSVRNSNPRRSYKNILRKVSFLLYSKSVSRHLKKQRITRTPKLFTKPLWFKKAIVDFKESRLIDPNYSCLYEHHPRLMRVVHPRRSRKVSLRVRREAHPRATLFMNIQGGRLNLPKASPLKRRILRRMLRFYRYRTKKRNIRKNKHYIQFLKFPKFMRRAALSARSSRLKLYILKVSGGFDPGTGLSLPKGYLQNDKYVSSSVVAGSDSRTESCTNRHGEGQHDVRIQFIKDSRESQEATNIQEKSRDWRWDDCFIGASITNYFFDSNKVDYLWNLIVTRLKKPLKTLNHYMPTVFNAAYYTKKGLKPFTPDFAIHSKYQTNFILSNVGFLYNRPLVYHIPSFWRTYMNKQQYSFFNIEFVKKTLLKRRFQYKIKQMGEVAPSVNYRRAADNNVFSLNTSHLLNINQLVKTCGAKVDQKYSQPFNASPSYYARLKAEVESREPRIRRIRFKPGYSRIWRSARASLNQALKLNFRYQHRLTTHLSRKDHRKFNQEPQLTELKLRYALAQARFTTDYKTTLTLLDSHTVFVNGHNAVNPQLVLFQGDVLQLAVHLKYYIVNRWLTNWNLFKRTRLAKLARSKFKKISNLLTKQRSRRTPNWVLEIETKRTDIAKYLEVDYFTLSAFVVYEPFLATEVNVEPGLETRERIYRLYNWKYLN